MKLLQEGRSAQCWAFQVLPSSVSSCRMFQPRPRPAHQALRPPVPVCSLSHPRPVAVGWGEWPLEVLHSHWPFPVNLKTANHPPW